MSFVNWKVSFQEWMLMNSNCLKKFIYSIYFSKAGIYTHNHLTWIRNFAKNFTAALQIKKLCMWERSCVAETSAGFDLLFLKAGSASWELVEGMHRAGVPCQNHWLSSDFGWSGYSGLYACIFLDSLKYYSRDLGNGILPHWAEQVPLGLPKFLISIINVQWGGYIKKWGKGPAQNKKRRGS